MKVIRGVGKLVKPFVNFPSWMGLRQLSSSGKGIANTAKGIYQPDAGANKVVRKETFAQAVKRLNLSEQDLQQRLKTFWNMTLVYIFVALGLFGYGACLCFDGHFAAAFLSFILTALALSLALRQHFWYFQIKQRRLGCSMKEWFKGIFRGTK